VKFKSNIESAATMIQEVQKLQEAKRAGNDLGSADSAAKKAKIIVQEIQKSETANKQDALKERLTRDNGLTSEQFLNVLQWLSVDINSPTLQTAMNITFTDDGVPNNPAELQPLIDLLTDLEFALPLFQSLSKFFNLSYSLLADILEWTTNDKAGIKAALTATFIDDGVPNSPAELQPLIDLDKEIERVVLLLSSNLKFKEEIIAHITERPQDFGIGDLKKLSLSVPNILQEACSIWRPLCGNRRKA
jgi:hypothetical protein